MENQVVTQTDKSIVATKREQWANMGEYVHAQEMALDVAAQQAIALIKEPVNIEDIANAEVVLKTVKAEQNAIQAKRKEVTSKFDAVTARLMEPEKSLNEPIQKLTASIVAIKSEHEKKLAAKKAIDDETQRIKLHFQNEQIRIDALLMQKVEELVSRCYQNALAKDVTPENIAAYIEQSKGAINDSHFIALVTLPSSTVLSAEEVTSLNDVKVNAEGMVKAFGVGVDAIFSDYQVAYANKAAAMQQAQEQEAKNREAIEAQKKQNEVAAKLESASNETEIAPVYGKALKKSYEVDMPDDVQSILSVMAAFSANIHLCLPKLKVTKWWAFTPQQAANALAKVKCDDNLFAPSGINFKEVEKL